MFHIPIKNYNLVDRLQKAIDESKIFIELNKLKESGLIHEKGKLMQLHLNVKIHYSHFK